MVARTDDPLRDGPVWFITMVIGRGCLALQPHFIVSAPKHDQLLPVVTTGCESRDCARNRESKEDVQTHR